MEILPAFILLVTVIAVVLDSAFMWPQAVKLVRTLDIAGVSALTWSFGIIFSVAWTAYAATIELWSLFASNIACTLAAVLALWAGTKAGWPIRYTIYSFLASAASILVAFVAPYLIVAVLTVGAVLFAIPQFIRILRSESVSGVSSATWWLNVAVSSSWLTVAVYNSALGVIIANVASIIALLSVLVALYYRRFFTPSKTPADFQQNNASSEENLSS